MVNLLRRSFAGLLLILAGCFAAPIAGQEKAEEKPRKVETVAKWKVIIADYDVTRNTPAPPYIADAKSLAALYKNWNLGDKVPEIDFKTEVVLVFATPVSDIHLEASLDEKGNLKTSGVGNRDFGTGYRAIFFRVKKDGVKSIDGKPFKE